MTKQTIEVEGLREGLKAVAFRIGLNGELAFDCNRVIEITGNRTKFPCLIVKKIQPRRIVLEETDTNASALAGQEIKISDVAIINISSEKKWRVVKENEVPLTNGEDKLSLSLDECKRIVNCTAPDVVSRILDFINNNNEKL